ncbi:hypothetical protein I7I51_08327 [Histoplasma capsulatum]|uniref:Uncharacterized protein n=1 Tax=Ajellomyces capsulatus TaxID=5037 RepID=A0A8A1M3Y2_AJECA|nr:hypothetical protein I7I51_08327 [Histoplasma capsulatum]
MYGWMRIHRRERGQAWSRHDKHALALLQDRETLDRVPEMGGSRRRGNEWNVLSNLYLASKVGLSPHPWMQALN